MSFRKATKTAPQTNSDRCLIQRQEYAKQMLKLLEAGKRIVNVDESWLNDSTYFYQLWAPKHQANSVAKKTVTPRISVIAAMDTDGRIWYSLLQANTDSEVFSLFMKSLSAQFDEELPGWRANTVYLLDGARYHTSPKSRAEFAKMGLQVHYTAPYSYPSSPVERLFAGLKRGELNQNPKKQSRR